MATALDPNQLVSSNKLLLSEVVSHEAIMKLGPTTIDSFLKLPGIIDYLNKGVLTHETKR